MTGSLDQTQTASDETLAQMPPDFACPLQDSISAAMAQRLQLLEAVL